jgi:hypothetical protein
MSGKAKREPARLTEQGQAEPVVGDPGGRLTGKQWARRTLFAPKGETGGAGGGAGSAAGPRGGPGAWLASLCLGEADRFPDLGGLEVFPLRRAVGGTAPALLFAHQALAAGLLEVVERGEGVVQELLAWNKGSRPVAILEGDTLVGCKQNRVVVRSVIVAAGTSVAVPVGCMERGRWHRVSDRFAAGAMRVDAGLRAASLSELKRGAGERRRRGVDQGRLWSDVEARLRAAGFVSPTCDLHSSLAARAEEVRQRSLRLRREADQVGALVLAEGRLVGVELAGDPEAWAALAERTLSSYLVARFGPRAKLRPDSAGTPALRAEDWLERLSRARVRTASGLGIGEDLDLEGEGVSGMGLWLDDALVHLAAFGTA